MDQATHGVLNVARSVLDNLDVEIVLQRVLEAARDLTGARFAALGVLDESRIELARFLSVGVEESDRWMIGQSPTGRGVLGELIRNPVPLRLSEVGSHARSDGLPADTPPMDSFLGVPVLVAGQPFGNLYVTGKQGGADFTHEDQDAVMLLAQFAGVAIDHARRYTRAEEARLELQRTVTALDATIQIARALGGEIDLDSILKLVAKRGRRLVGARTLVIELEREGELVIAAGAGELPAGLIGQRVSLRDTVASLALRTRASQRLTDAPNRARFEEHGLGQFGVRAGEGLVVPMVFRNQSYGALVALDRVDVAEPFTAEHQRLLEAFAASAAAAVATAQSAAGERRRQNLAAAEAERGRWARELHDETLQSLANLRLVLGSAQRSGTLEVMTAAIGRAVQQLEADIASLRALIADLRPATLDELGLEAAVRALAERLVAVGIEVDVSIELAWEQGSAEARHVPELEIALYRIVQEALTNATRHGDAHRAIVELVESDADVWLTVRDDGVGFEPGGQTSGFGLLGMRERAELLDGTLSIESSPGHGTTVSATLPLRRRDPAAGRADLLTPAAPTLPPS